MPLYSYECPRGHKVDRLRSMADRNTVFPCSNCLGRFDMSRPRIEMPKKGRLVIGGHSLYHHRIYRPGT